jgi:selT/selW/selH-like putative selenoprotein
LAEEIINEYGNDLESITLIRGEKGRFEVTANGKDVFSKEIEKRHPAPGEVLEKIGRLL